jgi:hypothetical protein
MGQLRAVNKKAQRIDAETLPALGASAAAHPNATPEALLDDVVALQGTNPALATQGPHIPMGCSFAFSPGWEVDSQGGTAGLCQPVERDIFDCYITCFWPAHVPDLYNHATDWHGKCASAQKDWRKVDLIFP